MEYHILTNINNKEPHQLQKPIENKNCKKKIGIKSITYYIGYIVFEREEFIRIGENDFYHIKPGIYSIDEIKKIFFEKGIFLKIEEGTFLVSLQSGYFGSKIFISNGIMSQLGFPVVGDVTFGHVNLEFNKGKAETPLKIPREVHVCLGELKTKTVTTFQIPGANI